MKMKVRILNVLISGNESNFFILKVCMNFNKRKNVFRVCVSRVFLKVYRQMNLFRVENVKLIQRKKKFLKMFRKIEKESIYKFIKK